MTTVRHTRPTIVRRWASSGVWPTLAADLRSTRRGGSPTNTGRKFRFTAPAVAYNPGSNITTGISVAGNTTGIVSTALFASLAGIQMVHVPYKGEPQAMTDLIAGRVQFLVATAATAAPHVRDGRLRALAVTLEQRSPALPDVPTIAEAGMPKFRLTSWAGVFGPAKMPADVAQRLNREFVAAIGRPEVQAAMAKQAFMLTGTSQDKLAALVREQLDSYKSTLKLAGIEPE